MLFWSVPISSIDELFGTQGFDADETVTREGSLRRQRIEQYHAAVEWEDSDHVRRVLRVYQAALDEYGRLPGGWLSPQARTFLTSLDRDGNLVIDEEIIVLEPEFQLEGPLGGATGWDAGDQEIIRLKRDYARASEAHDYNAVGLRCLRILALLADSTFSPSRHLPEGASEPGPADVKARIGQFVAAVAPGDRFEHLRKLVRDSYGQANVTKHRVTADRVDAGVAVASVLMLVEAVRLVADLELTAVPQ